MHFRESQEQYFHLALLMPLGQAVLCHVVIVSRTRVEEKPSSLHHLQGILCGNVEIF